MTLTIVLSFPSFVLGQDNDLPVVKESEQIRKAVKRLFGERYQVISIKQSGVKNILEVRINNELVYFNSEVTHMFIEGQLIQLVDGKNLTEERKKEFLSIEFRELPFEKAIVTDFSDSPGKIREIAVFEDPNCGFCRKFRKTLSGIENLRVYTFLYPILGENSIEISKNVWCSENPSQVWDDLMLNNVVPEKMDEKLCQFNLENFLEIGRTLGIEATPTAFLSNGERLTGAISDESLREKLAVISGEK